MDLCKKSVMLGLNLLTFCVFVEPMGLCDFAEMFPTQQENEMCKTSTPHAAKGGKNKNNKTATTVGETFTESVTATGGDTSLMTYQTSPLPFSDHLLHDTTTVLPHEHNTTSSATAELTATPGENKTNNKTTTSVGETSTENATATEGETSPMTYQTSPLPFSDQLLQDTTTVLPDEHNTASSATAEGATNPEKTETSNSKTATTVGKPLTGHDTTTGKETFKTYKISSQAVTEHLMEDTTAVGTDFDEHSITSPAAAEGPNIPGCGGYFDVSGDSFSSPNFPSGYNSNEDCSYVIEAPAGQVVLLNFSSFDIEPHSNCIYDAVKVYEGTSLSGTLLANLCGSTIPSAVYTNGNQMFVSFTTDYSSSYGGFRATVTFADPSDTPKSCDDTWTDDIGVLTSPNWPGFYDNNVECEYYIQGSFSQTVALSFDSFDVEDGSSCEFDYVEIRDGASSSSTLLAKLCGPTLPGTYTSSGWNLYVKFSTDSSETYGGFSASYTFQ